MHQVVELPARLRSAATNNTDLLRDSNRGDHYCDGVGILEVEDARCPVGQRACECLASRDAAVGIEPLNCARYVRKLGAILAVGVELGAVGNDQTLIRADRGCGGEHSQRELAGRRSDVADRKVGAWNERTLGRRDAVSLENLSSEHLRRHVAHAARCAAGELVQQRDVPRIARPAILDVEAELPPLPRAHRRRPGLSEHEIGRTNDSSDSDRDAGACCLRGSIPRYDAGVGDDRTGSERAAERGAEAQVDRPSGCQRSVGRRVVRGDDVAGNADTVGRAVHGRGASHVGERPRPRCVQVVRDHHRVYRVRGGVRHVHQVIERRARHRRAAPHHRHLLGDGHRRDNGRHRVRVLTVQHAGRTVGQRAGVALAAGVIARAVVPQRRTGHVGERGAVLCVRIELRLVDGHEALRRTDYRRGAQHVECQCACRRSRIAERVVRASRERALACDRRDAVRLEDPSTEHLRRHVAHAAGGGALGEPIHDRGVPCVAHARILDVKTKLP